MLGLRLGQLCSLGGWISAGARKGWEGMGGGPESGLRSVCVAVGPHPEEDATELSTWAELGQMKFPASAESM